MGEDVGVWKIIERGASLWDTGGGGGGEGGGDGGSEGIGSVGIDKPGGGGGARLGGGGGDGSVVERGGGCLGRASHAERLSTRTLTCASRVGCVCSGSRAIGSIVLLGGQSWAVRERLRLSRPCSAQTHSVCSCL